jgi:hypothetical protein
MKKADLRGRAASFDSVAIMAFQLYKLSIDAILKMAAGLGFWREGARFWGEGLVYILGPAGYGWR